MASSAVYIGRWTDYSLNGWSQDVLTLTVRDGGILIAALSTFVGFVGSAFWSLTAFWLHQALTRSKPRDAFHFQHQASYRNSGSPAAVLNDVGKMLWAWRRPSGGPPRVEHLKTRAFLLAFPPLIIFLGFTVAGVFVARIAGRAYDSNDVLLTSNICGYWSYNGTTRESFAASQEKVINDTLAGRAYASACYGKQSTTIKTDTTNCGLYPVKALNYTSQMVPCPFGVGPNGTSLCIPAQNTAYQLSTPQIDSNTLLGINAPAADRVTVSKTLTCAPLRTQQYVNSTGTTDYDSTSYWYLGPILGVTNYTYSYSPRIVLLNVGYQMTSVYSRDGAWIPVKALQVPTGDTSIHFMTPNSIRYLTPVDDLFFAAHDEYTLGSNKVYGSDHWESTMGCLDQFQICNPTTSPPSCTNSTSYSSLVKATQFLSLSAVQNATVTRLLQVLAQTDTYVSVAALGSFALQARTKVYGLSLSTGLPSNQWQLEVEMWFLTTLAKIQQYIIEYVSNSADLGPYGFVIPPDKSSKNPDIVAAATSMCHSQRVRNTGAYQTFSFGAIMIIVCVGGAIILLSWITEPVVGWIRKKSGNRGTKETARVADRTFQLLRIALGDGDRSGRGVWEKCLDDVPVTHPGVLFTRTTDVTATYGDVEGNRDAGKGLIYTDPGNAVGNMRGNRDGTSKTFYHTANEGSGNDVMEMQGLIQEQSVVKANFL